MMPAKNSKVLKNITMDDRQVLWTEAIINSMNKIERKNPNIIDGSRRLRIAKGSGRPVQEVKCPFKTIYSNEKDDEENE